MGSYGVIKEALLVKKNGSSDEYSVVQKLVPSTVNGTVLNPDGKDGFTMKGMVFSVQSIYHGGAFGLSEPSKTASLTVAVLIPGFGTKQFVGSPVTENVNGVGKCVKCTPRDPDPTGHYTHLCLVVESPVSMFAGKLN